MLSFIVAMDKNNLIGIKEGNKMPWHLPRDLQYFKARTTNHTIVMGRKTFESLGRVLPNRKHVVLTESEKTFPEEVEVVHDMYAWLKEAKSQDEEIFIIGGGTIFKQLLPYVDKLYITMIDDTFKGDVFFPEISDDEWMEVSCEKGIKDEKNPYDYYFLQYERKQ